MTVEDEKLIHKLRRENERLRKENRDLKRENEDLREEIGELKQVVQELEEAKKELEDELAEEKKPDYVQPNRKKENPDPSGRKVDHKGESRKKPSHVDTMKSLNPLKTCPDCGEEVSKPQEWRERYKEEIILPRYHVTKFRLPRSYCPRCDKLVEPEAGGILPKRQLGNKLRSYVVYLREELRLPVNMVRKHLENLGIEISEGTIENICSEAAEILKPHYEELKKELREAKATNNDETGKRIEGENRWKWVFAKQDTIVFHSDKRRSHEVMEEQYGKRPKPVLGSDCYSAYNPLDAVKQRCWSHLLDDSSDLEEEEGKSLHEDLKELYSEAKTRDRGPPLVRELNAKYCEGRLRELVDSDWSDSEAEKVAKRVRKHRGEWFNFIRYEEVEPTNNQAERETSGRTHRDPKDHRNTEERERNPRIRNGDDHAGDMEATGAKPQRRNAQSGPDLNTY